MKITTNKTESFRKDISTGKMFPKKDLIRIIKNNNVLEIDIEQNKLGRGSYIQKDINAILHAQKVNSLAKSFKTKINISFYEDLMDFVNGK